ncbi:MMB_0454 family protein [Candidatus Mycoplasma pogonae]
MEYVIVNYNLNNTYNIHRDVFTKVINNALEKHSEIILLKPVEIILVEKRTNIKIYVDFAIKKNYTLAAVAETIKAIIQQEVKNIIGIDPKNIQLNYQGRKDD